MDTLVLGIGKERGERPDGAKQMVSVEDTIDIMRSIRSVESKAAYNIRIIAAHLSKASKSLDPKKQTSGPDDLPFYIRRSNNIFFKDPSQVTMSDLGELEDLYYATCAKHKDLLSMVNIHLSNKFKAPEDEYFTFTSPAFRFLGPIKVAEFMNGLLLQEKILYDERMMELLDRAVRRKNYEEQKQLADQSLVPVYDGLQPGPDHDHPARDGKLMQNLRGQADVAGLEDVRNKPCGLIFGALNEKYRFILHKEQLQKVQDESSIASQASHATNAPDCERLCNSPFTYVSKSDLNERAKRLGNPGCSDTPCISDPECICAPPCASDRTPGCLCEDNAPFCGQTDTWNVSDLNISDRRNEENAVHKSIEGLEKGVTSTGGSKRPEYICSHPWVSGLPDYKTAAPQQNDEIWSMWDSGVRPPMQWYDLQEQEWAVRNPCHLSTLSEPQDEASLPGPLSWRQHSYGPITVKSRRPAFAERFIGFLRGRKRSPDSDRMAIDAMIRRRPASWKTSVGGLTGQGKALINPGSIGLALGGPDASWMSPGDTDPDTFYAAYDAAKERLLLSLLAKIDVVALVSAASRARDGLQCTVPALAHGELNLELVQSQMGGQNCHLDIEFEDGTVSLARIRLDDPLLPPKPTRKHIFMTESGANLVGASYVLMEKLPGAPLRWDKATSEQRSKVMSQLADIFLELEKRPLPSSGSLCLSHDVPIVSGFAQPPLFSSPDQTLGPFETLESSLRAMILQQQDQIVNGELSSLAVDNYLSHCWRHDMITHVTTHCHESGPGFFLKHFDDKGDHILVDADFNITGIIDWEFASAEPKALAFSTPCILWPVGEFYDGKGELSAEEIEFAEIFEARGRENMGKTVRESRKMQRFTFYNGGGLSRDQEEFRALFTGLRAAWAREDEQPSSYEDWKRDAKARQKGD